MERRIILRGGLLGALGGLLAFVFARIFAEPIIQRAIEYEEGRDEAQHKLEAAAGGHSHGDGAELFTRAVQSNFGIAVGIIAFGFAMGLLFAVLYTVLYGRYSSLNPTNLTLVLAGAMFFVLYLVPFLKYPANPPAVGHEDTIRARTGLYLLMVVVSIAALVFAVWLARRLTERFGNWNAALLAGAAFIVIVGIVMLALPSLGQLSTNVAEYGDYATETPQPLKDAAGNIVFPGFPADDLYYFRLYSIGAQIILWATIALGFAPFARRLLGDRSEKVAA
ncbi:MAG: CbtA family protein [Mycolicibacterium sp.]|nr:CbtA family protein [Mycolicibacterium sp.]